MEEQQHARCLSPSDSQLRLGSAKQSQPKAFCLLSNIVTKEALTQLSHYIFVYCHVVLKKAFFVILGGCHSRKP